MMTAMLFDHLPEALMKKLQSSSFRHYRARLELARCAKMTASKMCDCQFEGALDLSSTYPLRGQKSRPNGRIFFCQYCQVCFHVRRKSKNKNKKGNATEENLVQLLALKLKGVDAS
ncbi:unnamed protein product [Amoebophrya sp. A120]|nr:unnamed protein product [Amoebophrya sp. A120]|eukprot:GSA120T00014818001.1